MEPLAPEPVTEIVTAKKSRLRLGRTASTALLLAFFFAVGLAGGVLYRLVPTTTNEKVAVHDAVPPGPPPAIAQSTVPSAETVAPAKIAAPAKAPAAPAQIAAAHPVPSPIASAPLPVAPPATTPPPIAPMAGAVTPEAAQFAPASAQPTAAPALEKPAPPSPAKAPSGAGAKPKLAMAKAKAPPAKHPPVVAAAPASTGSAEGPVRVQFGAFSIEDNAHRVQWAIQATGMQVDVAQLPSPKGRQLYYVRSQPFPNRAAAISAAKAAQDKAKTLVNPVAIEYIILPDTPTPAKPAQQAQAPGH